MRTLVVGSLLLGLVFSCAGGASAQSSHSPTGTWLVAMSGADCGLARLTFSNNFTWTGYGLSLESFGPLAIAGTWTNDNKGEVVGGYNESFPDGTVIGWSISAKPPRRAKFSGKSVSLFNGHLLHLSLRGASAQASPDVSGNWVGKLRTRGPDFFEQYSFAASANKSNWFDVAGQGANSSGTFTISGALIVNTDRRANGYTIRDFGSSVTETSSFSGRFSFLLKQAKFVGKDDDNHTVIIRATRQE